jgi:hypothetical protein
MEQADGSPFGNDGSRHGTGREKPNPPQLTLQLEAHDCNARGDWASAEACYRKVLALEEASGNRSGSARHTLISASCFS